MAFTIDVLTVVFDRTAGRCHICAKRLALGNYGAIGGRAAWEVDHSVARARGGTDRISNLLPACIPCNRSKQDRSSRAARAERGHSRKPMSIAEQERARLRNAGQAAAAGGAVGLLVAGPPGAFFGAAVAGLVGGLVDPDDR